MAYGFACYHDHGSLEDKIVSIKCGVMLKWFNEGRARGVGGMYKLGFAIG